MGPKQSKDGNKEVSDPFGIGTDEVLKTTDKERVALEDFDLLAVVGKGSFGKVMQVRKENDGKIFAMKVLRKQLLLERNQIDHTRFERWFLEQDDHPFIVTLRYAFQTDDKLYMILDYVNGGELFFHLKREGRFSEERVKLYMAELVMAIEHLHSIGVIYRDLKPENILVRMDGHIQITDFGLSKQINEEAGEKTYTFCGTPEYLAPEMLDGSGHGKSVDWWALGTLAFELLTGLPPFYHNNVNVMYHRILFDEIVFPDYPEVSEQGKDFIRACLNKDAQSRLGGSYPDIAYDIRAHPWFEEYDWDKLFCHEIDAPWRPPVTDMKDISMFDTEFTNEIAMDSVVDEHLPVDADEQALFQGFTFTRQDGMTEAAVNMQKRAIRGRVKQLVEARKAGRHSLVHGPRPTTGYTESL